MSAPFDHLGERALLGLLGVDDLVLVHQLDAAFVDDAGQVGHPDVLARHAELDQQAEAGERRGAGAGGDELDLLDLLAADLQRVQHAGADDDRRAVLVVVEDRDLHARAQRALDVEAVRRLDVLEVDAAEGRLERGDQVDQLVEVLLVDLDVEHVDAGELLEQHPLAFHHRLGGERADVAQAEHRGAVGDDRDEVAARGVAERVRRVGDDLLAGRGDAGRIGEREVVLVDELLGRVRSRPCRASETRDSRGRRGAARRRVVL